MRPLESELLVPSSRRPCGDRKLRRRFFGAVALDGGAPRSVALRRPRVAHHPAIENKEVATGDRCQDPVRYVRRTGSLVGKTNVAGDYSVNLAEGAPVAVAVAPVRKPQNHRQGPMSAQSPQAMSCGHVALAYDGHRSAETQDLNAIVSQHVRGSTK